MSLFWGRETKIQGSNERKYLESQKKVPKGHKKPFVGKKLFEFCDAIIAYYYLSRNPKFAMETVN